MPTDAFLSTKRLNAGKDVRIRAIVFAEVSRSVVGSEQQAECVSIHFAGEFHGVVGIDDRACVDRGDLRVEDVDAFEKERPLLFEEDRKALVCSDD